MTKIKYLRCGRVWYYILLRPDCSFPVRVTIFDELSTFFDFGRFITLKLSMLSLVRCFEWPHLITRHPCLKLKMLRSICCFYFKWTLLSTRHPWFNKSIPHLLQSSQTKTLATALTSFLQNIKFSFRPANLRL